MIFFLKVSDHLSTYFSFPDVLFHLLNFLFRLLRVGFHPRSWVWSLEIIIIKFGHNMWQVQIKEKEIWGWPFEQKVSCTQSTCCILMYQHFRRNSGQKTDEDQAVFYYSWNSFLYKFWQWKILRSAPKKICRATSIV